MDTPSPRRASPIGRAALRTSNAARFLIAAIALATAATAQTTEELKADAYDAAHAVEEARQRAAEASEQLKAAEEAAELAEAAVGAAGNDAPGASSADHRAIEEARQEAARASQTAEQALAAVEELRQRFAFDRRGTYLGGSVFWAPQTFDTRVDVDASRGFAGWLGYRFAPNFAAEFRGDRLDDFDLVHSGFVGTLDGWVLSGNAKVFLLTNRFQPYIDLGLGAFVSQLDWEETATGERTSEKFTEFLFRVGGGIDYYVTPSLAVNLEASFVSVTGNLSAVRFGQLGGGLTLRF